MKKYSLFKISASWTAVLYILFAVVYPHVHVHAHEANTGKEILFSFHPPTPCPLPAEDHSDHHECHHLPHTQTSYTEFYQPSPKNLRHLFPNHEGQLNLSYILPTTDGENEYTTLLYYSIEPLSIPPPPEWLSNCTSRAPPVHF